MTPKKAELERFEEVTAIIRRDFPNLRMEITHAHPHLEAVASIPVQAGLPFAVDVQLQNNDELHLQVSRFWMAWFPCGKQPVFDEFVEAITAVLSGRGRILESYVFGNPATARLQLPTSHGNWRTIATWSNPWAFVPWRREHRIVRNGPSPDV